MQGKVAKIVEEGLSEVVLELGFELYEVDYIKKQNGMNLTLFITKKDDTPVTIQDCELVHRTVDPILDEINPTNDQPYYLNVSSLGLDRPVKSDKDFARMVGKELEVKLFKKLGEQKQFVGVLKDFSPQLVSLQTEKGLLQIERNNIALCKQNIKF